MTILHDEKGPRFEFCCGGARRAWDADALVIVPEPHDDGEPYRFFAAIDYEGGAALTIAYCPFCGVPAAPSERR